jgi:hypothetical protein
MDRMLRSTWNPVVTAPGPVTGCRALHLPTLCRATLQQLDTSRSAVRLAHSLSLLFALVPGS